MAESFLTHEYTLALNMWQVVMTNLRRFLRGYGANFRGGRGGYRRRKAELVEKIVVLDKKVKEGNLDSEEWSQRYMLEG
jgi:hypothetical protein